MYTQILDKAFADDASDEADITKEILKAVVVAICPLTLYELAVAADVPKEDWNDGNSLKEYVSQCRSLLTLRTDVGNMCKNTTVHLVHQSAKDFLISSKCKLVLSPELAEEHGDMARRSISYFCSGVFANGPINPRNPNVIEPLASQSDDQSSTQDVSGVSSDEGGSWRSPIEEEHAGNENGAALEHVPDLEPLMVLHYQMDNWMLHGRQASPNIGDLFDLYREFFEPNSDIRDSWFASCMFPPSIYQWIGMPVNFTPLQLGAYSGIYALVKKILDFSAEVQVSQPESLIDTRDSMGWTALIWVVEHGYEMVTKLLLDRGAGVDVVNNKGDTALIIASSHGRRAVVQMLLNSGTFVNAQNYTGQTALVAASSQGHDEVVRLLLQHNADIEMSDKDSRTALWWGAYKGDEILVKLLLHHEAGTDIQDKTGNTALIIAAQRGYDKIVKILLQSKADVEQKDSDGCTALMHAVLSDHNKVIEILLQHGADIEQKNTDGSTALTKAALGDHDSVVEILLRQGANINSTDRRGFSILWHAAVRGHEETVKILLKHGANLGTYRQEQEGDAISALCFAALKYSEAGIDYITETKVFQSNHIEGRRIISTREADRLHLTAEIFYEASLKALREHEIKSEDMVDYHMKVDADCAYRKWVLDSRSENYNIARFLALIDRQQSVVRLLLHDRAKKSSTMEGTEKKDKATESRVGYRLAERLNHWKNPAWRSDSRDRPTISDLIPKYNRESSAARRMSSDSVD